MKILLLLGLLFFLLLDLMLIFGFYPNSDDEKKAKKENPVYEKAANDLFMWQGVNLNSVYLCNECCTYHRRHTLISTYILKAINEKNYDVNLDSNGQCPVCNQQSTLQIKSNYPEWLDNHATCLKVTDKSTMTSIKTSLVDLFKQWEIIKQTKEYDEYSEGYEKLKAKYKEELR